MRRWPRPRVVVSACLEFENVRYDGKVIPCEIVKQLQTYVDYIKVCPEYAVGLGVPREPIRIIKKDGDYRLVQPKTGRDVTEIMDEFTDSFLESLASVDGFIFKSRSPTIALTGIKVYRGPFDPAVLEKRSGFFAKKIIEKYRGYPMEEDARLINDKIRHHFLTKLFAFAGLREALGPGRLKEFHAQNRYLFMAYDPDITQEMKAIAARGNGGEYKEAIKRLFAKMPMPKGYLEASARAFERYSGWTDPYEEKWFHESQRMYRDNKICLNGLLEALKLFAIKFHDEDMASQTIFEPYPPELASDVDEEREKDYMKNIAVDLF